jgi:hypothetical protein
MEFSILFSDGRRNSCVKFVFFREESAERPKEGFRVRFACALTGAGRRGTTGFMNTLRMVFVMVLIAAAPTLAASTGGKQGPTLDDAAFFAALDVSRPDMAQVKSAVENSDLAAAKRLFVEHLKSRSSPKRHFDWRKRKANPQDAKSFNRSEAIASPAIGGRWPLCGRGRQQVCPMTAGLSLIPSSRAMTRRTRMMQCST